MSTKEKIALLAARIQVNAFEEGILPDRFRSEVKSRLSALQTEMQGARVTREDERLLVSTEQDDGTSLCIGVVLVREGRCGLPVRAVGLIFPEEWETLCQLAGCKSIPFLQNSLRQPFAKLVHKAGQDYLATKAMVRRIDVQLPQFRQQPLTVVS